LRRALLLGLLGALLLRRLLSALLRLLLLPRLFGALLLLRPGLLLFRLVALPVPLCERGHQRSEAQENCGGSRYSEEFHGDWTPVAKSYGS
jgi:predicted tellurium resistance membrane protein TerC